MEPAADTPPEIPALRVDRTRERAVKSRGVLLATAGLFLALCALVYYRAAGLSDASWTTLASLASVTVVVQGILWSVPRLGWDRHLHRDEDYVRVPLSVAAFLLFSYAAVVPEARYLMLAGWFVALLFGLRFLDFGEVVRLGVLATGLYVLSLLVHVGDAPRHDITWRAEGGQAAVLLGMHVFVAGLFERVRREHLEREDLRRQLVEESVTDPLTGVRNRRYLERFLETEAARAQRYETECSVAMLDLDHFKVYNDAHGHPAGDGVLRGVADILRAEARQADVVARYGGEEFVQIMPETGLEDARSTAERIRRTVEERRFPGEEVLPDGITVSLGVASLPANAETAKGLIQAADQALYRAKERGRNRVVCAGETIEAVG